MVYYEVLPIVVVYDDKKELGLTGRLFMVIGIICGVYVIIGLVHNILLKIIAVFGFYD